MPSGAARPISSRTLSEMEAAAKATATAHVINMLQRPGQLEKVDQHRQRLARKKASVETMLKSAMQHQLNGVNSGLTQLHNCLEIVQAIGGGMRAIGVHLKEVPQLLSSLSEVREENMRHSQYVTARENLKHIFTVPDSVARTKAWIADGKLLHAHQCLRDLENSRDDLLYELHKLPNQSAHDKSLLKAYFSDVEELSGALEKQLRLILSRTLTTVRKEPTVIVTALRIIEREEKADAEILEQQRQSGFLPPARPKRWKHMALAVLEKAVVTRIESANIEERHHTKHWLIRHLELSRQFILEDLRVVRGVCVPCFPPSYNIVEVYVRFYHECLGRHLMNDVIRPGLEGNEFVTLLNWLLNVYRSGELLGHPDLVEFTRDLDVLIPVDVVEKLQSDYLRIVEGNYVEWMRNTLMAEELEWRKDGAPEETSLKATAAPIIIFQMIDQNVQVATTISPEFTVRIIQLSMDQVCNYGVQYRKAVGAFKTKYFEDRKLVPYFTQHMCSVLNNCHQLTELAGRLEKQYTSMAVEGAAAGTTTTIADVFNKLRATFLQLRNDAGDYLLDELTLDVDRHFADLFTTKWYMHQVNPAPVDTICATLDDYLQDYTRLTPANFAFIVQRARSTVAKRYLVALLSKRTTFKTFAECQQAANRILTETAQIEKLFSAVGGTPLGTGAHLHSEEDHPNTAAATDDAFVAVHYLVEVLKSDDDMLSFELHRVVDKYPDIGDDHLLRLLSLRGDLNRTDVKQKVAHLPRSTNSRQYQPTVFKNLVFQKLLNINVFQ